MPPLSARIGTFLRQQQRALAAIAVAILLFNVLVTVSRALEPDAALAGGGLVSDDPGAVVEPGTPLPDGTIAPVAPGGNGIIPTPRGTLPKGNNPNVRTPIDELKGTLLPGVTDDEIRVVYYWKGERTMTSPFIGGTEAEGQNLDEALAFRRYIEYINRHDGDGTTFMGVPIRLYGRKLVGTVLEAGNGGFSYGQTAEKIADEIRPLAAVAAHGSLSAYICPRLAEAGIHNMATYDLGGKGGNLIDRSNGYCIGAGIPWERQVDVTIGFLRRQMHEPTTLGQKRVYGLIYTAYPGLADVAEAMIEKLKDAGIPIAATARLPDSLADSQTQAPNVITQMRLAGVNTLIMPEAGSPLNITHAAQANQYYPDYYVWPCSGTDNTGMVRLFSAPQWERAEGLTCYDREYDGDVTNTDKSRDTEWYEAYREVAPGKEPPAPAPLVYAGLAQVIAGLSYAGPDLTLESWRAGLDAVPKYRYDAIDGVTRDRSNMTLDIGSRDRAVIADAAFVKWETTARESGGPQGAYVYPEQRRYARRSQF